MKLEELRRQMAAGDFGKGVLKPVETSTGEAPSESESVEETAKSPYLVDILAKELEKGIAVPKTGIEELLDEIEEEKKPERKETGPTRIDFVSMYYRQGKSDKVYEIHLWKQVGGKFTVEAEWGRRGKSMRTAIKYDGVNLGAAQSVFNELRNSKYKKGYQTA